MSERTPDGVRGKITRFRAPGGAPDPQPAEEPAALGYHDRAIPTVSVLWTPLGSENQRAPSVPIFIKQQALTAMHEPCMATPGTCFGLLGGDLHRSPASGAPYVLVESAVPLAGEPGQDAMTTLSQGWPTGNDALRQRGLHPVGWYRAGASLALEPSAAELEAHAAWFRQPWQIVVTAVSGAVPLGGVYRPMSGNGSPLPPLPFYEVVDRSAEAPDPDPRGRWTNYRSDRATPDPSPSRAPQGSPIPPAPATAPPAARPTPLLFLSDESDDTAPQVRVSAGRWLTQRPAVRVATYATGGLVAALGLLRLFFTAPAAPVLPPIAQPAAVPPLERLDRAGDTVALAVAAFDLRARLFASHQMQCPELARGLVQVEDHWAAYNVARKGVVGALDSARTARDRALYVDADAVERRFEASACPRP